MPWLWYVAPVVAILIYALTGLPGRHEARRNREIERFRALMTPSSGDGPKTVGALPEALRQIVPELGGGQVVRQFELIAKLAYVAIMGPDLANGSEYQAVIARLDKPGPELTLHPLPIIDGAPVPNTGVMFKKDPEFTKLFLVEGPNAKAIVKWLPRGLRDALRDLPEAWLYVRDRVMAVVCYGPVDADRMEALVVAADAIFAEHGAEGGPSLLFDDEDGGEDASDREKSAKSEHRSPKQEPTREAKPAGQRS